MILYQFKGTPTWHKRSLRPFIEFFCHNIDAYPYYPEHFPADSWLNFPTYYAQYFVLFTSSDFWEPMTFLRNLLMRAHDNITEKHSSRSIYIPSFLAAAGVIQFTRQTNNILLLCKCTTRFVLIRGSYKNKFPFPNGGVSCTYFVAFCNWKYKADFWLSLRI